MSRFPVWAGCVILAVFLGTTVMSLSSQGHPVTLPLDDAYIYLQYARTALDGHFGEYFPGDGRSAGATSPLWLFLTTGVGFLHQLTGRSLERDFPAMILILSTMVTALTFWLGFRLARANGAGAVGAWAVPITCLLTPIWMFGMMNGMETGLYAAALLGAALTLSGGSRGWLVLLALVRPEGAGLALLILIVTMVRARHRDPDSSGIGGISLGLVAAAALFTLMLPWILTGGPASAWSAKSLLVEPDPDIRGFYFPKMPYFALRVLWFGLSGGQFQPGHEVTGGVFLPGSWPGWLWVMLLAGGTVIALAHRRARTPFLLWAVASMSALISAAWDAQFYRYLVPAYSLLVVTATVGWFGSSWRKAGEREKATLDRGSIETRRIPGSGHLRPILWRGAGAGLLLLIGLGSLAGGDLQRRFTRLYRGECERVASNQVLVGDWLRRNTTANARVATHDVGAIAFAGDRSILDLVGLVSTAMTGAYRHGEGALWEAMDSLPMEDRPTHLAVIPAWMPYLSRTLWAGKRLWGIEARSSGPVSQDFEVRELSWPGSDSSLWPGGDFGSIPRNYGSAAGRSGWIVVDAVDVADLHSEREHEYRGRVNETPTVVRNLGFAPVREPRAVAMEGGRDVVSDVEFVFREVGDTPALLILRSASARETTVTVHIGGWSDELVIPGGEIRFRESAILIPPEVLQSSIEGTVRVRVEGSGYRAFHWWILQPEAGDPQP